MFTVTGPRQTAERRVGFVLPVRHRVVIFHRLHEIKKCQKSTLQWFESNKMYVDIRLFFFFFNKRNCLLLFAFSALDFVLIHFHLLLILASDSVSVASV